MNHGCSVHWWRGMAYVMCRSHPLHVDGLDVNRDTKDTTHDLPSRRSVWNLCRVLCIHYLFFLSIYSPCMENQLCCVFAIMKKKFIEINEWILINISKNLFISFHNNFFFHISFYQTKHSLKVEKNEPGQWIPSSAHNFRWPDHKKGSLNTIGFFYFSSFKPYKNWVKSC
jgi:hypothetical protein